MSDIREYRGYITIPDGLSEWNIVFPDFPQLYIKINKEFLKKSEIAYEAAFTAVVDEIIAILECGRAIPVPQAHVEYDKNLIVDLAIDIEEICQHLCLKLAN